MKRGLSVFFGAILMALAMAPVGAHGELIQNLKVGGGFLWNDESALDATGGGLHVSADVHLHNRVDVTPFYEFSRRNGVTSSLLGGEFHYNVPAGFGTFYVGPGFGVANANGSTEFHVNGVGGVKVGLSSWLGVFVQGKYAWAADDLVNGITAHAGVMFPFGRVW